MDFMTIIGYLLIYGGGIFAIIGIILTFLEFSRDRKAEKRIAEKYFIRRYRIEDVSIAFDPKIEIETDENGKIKSAKLEV